MVEGTAELQDASQGLLRLTLTRRAFKRGRLIMSCNTSSRSVVCVIHKPAPTRFLCHTDQATQLPYRELSHTTTCICCPTRSRCKMLPHEMVLQPALHAREGGTRLSMGRSVSRIAAKIRITRSTSR